MRDPFDKKFLDQPTQTPLYMILWANAVAIAIFLAPFVLLVWLVKLIFQAIIT